jgi:hypothetical protein
MDNIEKVDSSKCHAFIDYKSIWSLEIVEDFDKPPVPILNVITFTDDEAPLRPEQIHIYNRQGKRAEIKRFAIDTGVAGDPYITNFLKVLGNSFFGMDLTGDFTDFQEPTQVSIELGEYEYQLQAVACLDFEALAQQVDKINVNSPDIREDFSVLKIPHLGKKGPRKRGRR